MYILLRSSGRERENNLSSSWRGKNWCLLGKSTCLVHFDVSEVGSLLCMDFFQAAVDSVGRSKPSTRTPLVTTIILFSPKNPDHSTTYS